MRIVIDARELCTTTGRYVERLLYYLQQLDPPHDFVVLLKPADFAGWQPTNPRFVKIPCPYKEFSLGEQLGFLRQLRSLKADLVHFPMVQQPAFYTGNVVTTMNDLTTTRFRNPAKNAVVFWLKQQVYVWLNKRVAHKSTAIITYSAYVRDDVAHFATVPSKKCTVIPLGADKITKKSVVYKPAQAKSFLLYVGRPLPHKNLENLIYAQQKLVADRPEVWLVLAGKKDANYARHERLVVERGIKNVLFTGYVSEGELRWLYEHCAAYVFPSLSEGFGLPGLEAMVHGAPVVSSNATCLPEVYGDAAHYFDPLNVDDIARKITEVLDNQALRNNLIARGHAQAATYSWRRMAEQTLAVYEACLAKQT